MKSTLLDIKKASVLLKLTPQQVRNICRDGKLNSIRVGSTWAIELKDINKYKGGNLYKTNQPTEDRATKFSHDRIISIKKPKVLSFFSGAMGLDLGLERAGFEVLLCCEVNNACRKTITTNRPEVALIGDINAYSAEQIKESAGLSPSDDIDLIVGGPPCQSFSTAGRRKGFEDERGNVFLTFVERILELRPKFAVIENVRGLLSAPFNGEKGGALTHVLKKMNSAGYGVSFTLYNTANFGVPQKRERVVIICSRNGEKLPYLMPTHSENGEFGFPKWKTFKEAIVGLPKIGHHHLNFPEKRLRYYRMLRPGQHWRHLPEEMQKEALGKSYYSGGGKTGFLRRLSWDAPSPTLVTHPAMPATDLAHPIEERPLSVEEYMRIQQFPDSWRIEGTLLEQYRQIGNAVPVGLGCAIGRLILSYVNGEKISKLTKFPYSRYSGTSEVTWEKRSIPKVADFV